MASLGSVLARQQFRNDYSHTHVHHCLYIFIQLRRLRRREEKRKCPNFETVAKGIRTRALSIASPAFYHWATTLRKIRNLTYLNAIDVLTTNNFSTFAHRIIDHHTNQWLKRINCITSVYRQLIVHKPMLCLICGDWFSYLLMQLTQGEKSVVVITGHGNLELYTVNLSSSSAGQSLHSTNCNWVNTQSITEIWYKLPSNSISSLCTSDSIHELLIITCISPQPFSWPSGLEKFYISQNDSIKNHKQKQVRGLPCVGSWSDLKCTAYWMSFSVLMSALTPISQQEIIPWSCQMTLTASCEELV